MSDSKSGGVSSAPVRVQCRRDLTCVQTLHKNESAVVVKDPIALKYHRLRPDEYFVLQCLDGVISLDGLREKYEAKFPPRRVSTGQLNQLLFRFHQSGLTLSNAPGQGDQLTGRATKERRTRWLQQLSGLLFIRFPGIDPEPVLNRIYPFVRPFLGRLGCIAGTSLVLLAIALFLGHREEFIVELPRMSQWLQADAILLLAFVIGCTKVFHELGHAIACKHFGGECHQIGPMLLVFTPALYCDTSDSWMLPSRWQRAAVGMAGIGAEILLACIATLIWVASSDGVLHTAAMNVMLVCSISTLLFNANPLLRYDGYYVLSDLTDTPNLGERARKQLAGFCARLFLGVSERDIEPDSRSGFWLGTYAVLATVYRWTLSLVILWIISVMLRPYGLESVGRLLCAFAAAGLVVMLLRNPIRFLRNPSRRRYLKMKRMVIAGIGFAALVAASFVPFPSSVSSDGRIIPRHEVPIYVSTAGELVKLMRHPGDQVRKGEAIAQLSNVSMELDYLRSLGRAEQQSKLVETMVRARLTSPEVGSELPGARALLEELQKQVESRKQRLDSLLVTAPCDGKLMAVARRFGQRSSRMEESELTLASWTGYPTDQANALCYLQQGDELMTIATEPKWDAELRLDQSQVRRIEIGADVKLICEAMPSRVIRGSVVDISESRWRMEENSPRQDDPQVVQQMTSPSTSYIVRVQVPESDIVLVSGTTVASSIQAKPISVAGRALRTLNSLFRFRQ